VRRKNSTISGHFVGKVGNLSEKREYRGSPALISARFTRDDANFQAGFVQERDDSGSIQGFGTIVRELARASEYPDILGSEKETQALTQQWLEYATVRASYADLPQNTSRILNVIHETHVVPVRHGRRRNVVSFIDTSFDRRN